LRAQECREAIYEWVFVEALMPKEMNLERFGRVWQLVDCNLKGLLDGLCQRPRHDRCEIALLDKGWQRKKMGQANCRAGGGSPTPNACSRTARSYISERQCETTLRDESFDRSLLLTAKGHNDE